MWVLVVHHLISRTQSFSVLISCFLFFCEGNVTRHDPEEHWEDQEATKQQHGRLVLMFAQPSQTPPPPSEVTLLLLTFPAVQLSSAGRRLDDHLHQNNQAQPLTDSIIASINGHRFFFIVKYCFCFKPFENANILWENKETSHRRQEARCIF